MRTAIVTVAVLAAIVVAALFALPGLFDARALLQPIEARAGDAGLTLSIDGASRIRVLWRPTLEIGGVTVSDRTGRKVAEARRIEGDFDLFDLVAGDPSFDTVHVVDGTLPLDGRSLAKLSALAPAGADSVVMEGGRIGLDPDVSVTVRELRLAQDTRSALSVQGTLGRNGTVRLEGALSPAREDGLRPGTLALSSGQEPVATVNAMLGRADDGWLLDEIALALPGLTLRGDGVIHGDDRWTVSMGLGAKNGSLDELPGADIAAVLDMASRIGGFDLVLRLEAAEWRGGTVRDLQMDMSADEGHAEIVALVATLPGMTTISLSGATGRLSGPDAGLAGKALADTGNAVELLDWLGAASPWAASRAPRHAVVDGGFRFDADTLDLEILSARLRSATLTGDFAMARDASRFDALLKANALNLDDLAAPDWLLPVASAEFGLDLHVEDLRSDNGSLGPATLRARGNGEHITLETLALPNMSGMSLSIEGAVEKLQEVLELDLAFQSAGATHELWQALDIMVPRWLHDDGVVELAGTLRGPLSDAAVDAGGRYGDLPVKVGGQVALTLDGVDYALDVLAERTHDPAIRLPVFLEGDADDLTATVAEGALIDGIPLAGSIGLGFGDESIPVGLKLHSQVGPILAALGTNARATGDLEVHFDGAIARGEPGFPEALEGAGAMTVRDGAIEGFGLGPLDREIARAKGPIGLVNLIAQMGNSGTTRLKTMDIPFTVDGGKLEIRNAAGDAEGADMQAAGVVEIGTGRVDLHTRMWLDSTPEAPPIALDIRGHWNKLRARIDFNDLQRFLLEDGR